MYDELIHGLLRTKAWKATKYLSQKEVVRAVRTRFGNKFSRGGVEVTLSKCKPNFREREKAQKMGKEIVGMTFYTYIPKQR